MTAADSLFERAVAVRRKGPGRYSAAVETAFNGPISPNGGVLAAMLTRAGEAELGPAAPPPRTVAAQYLEAPSGGSVTIAVEALRRGRRVAAADARMFEGDRLICQASIVFSASRSDAIDLQRESPGPGDPDDLPILDPARIRGAPPVFNALEVRVGDGSVPFAAGRRAETGGWLALRDDPAPLDAARLVAFSDLWWPAVFPYLDRPVGVPTLQLTVHLRTVAEPVQGPAFVRFRSRHVTEGHVEETGEVFSRDGRLLAESRQLSLTLG